MSKGTKNDKGKPRISLIPKEALWGMADAFTYGAKKYGDHNFRGGIEYTRLADACMRHLTAFISGEDLDDESGNCHIDHALASLGMLKFMMSHRKEMDDRYKDVSEKEENKSFGETMMDLESAANAFINLKLGARDE